jgi:DNA-binding FrmR family transcriptional regulator
MHSLHEREKLLARIRRIAGQIKGAQTALEKEDESCTPVLHALTAAKGAINSLIVEIVEDHVRFHIVNPDDKPGSAKAEATQELLDVLRSYLK